MIDLDFKIWHHNDWCAHAPMTKDRFGREICDCKASALRSLEVDGERYARVAFYEHKGYKVSTVWTGSGSQHYHILVSHEGREREFGAHIQQEALYKHKRLCEQFRRAVAIEDLQV